MKAALSLFLCLYFSSFFAQQVEIPIHKIILNEKGKPIITDTIQSDLDRQVLLENAKGFMIRFEYLGDSVDIETLEDHNGFHVYLGCPYYSSGFLLGENRPEFYVYFDCEITLVEGGYAYTYSNFKTSYHDGKLDFEKVLLEAYKNKRGRVKHSTEMLKHEAMEALNLNQYYLQRIMSLK